MAGKRAHSAPNLISRHRITFHFGGKRAQPDRQSTIRPIADGGSLPHFLSSSQWQKNKPYWRQTDFHPEFEYFDASTHYLPRQWLQKLFFQGSLLSCYFLTRSITFWYCRLRNRLLKVDSPFVCDLCLGELKTRSLKQFPFLRVYRWTVPFYHRRSKCSIPKRICSLLNAAWSWKELIGNEIETEISSDSILFDFGGTENFCICRKRKGKK
jgi:hypothetical protein